MLHLKLITPNEMAIDEMVERVTVPTKGGVITILNHHIPLVSSIDHGELVVHKGGKEKSYAVHSGVVQIRKAVEGVSEVIVLMESVDPFDSLDETIRSEALLRAKHLSEEKVEDFEFGQFESLIERELSKVKWRRKR